jgi:hypothetical protein
LQFVLKNSDFWCDKTNIRTENWIESANKTPLMSEVTVDNKLKLGTYPFQKGGTIIFFSKAGLTRQSFVDILYIHSRNGK